jgi:hypothetical protein
MDRRGAPPGRHVEPLEPRPNPSSVPTPIGDDDALPELRMALTDVAALAVRAASGAGVCPCTRLLGILPRGKRLISGLDRVVVGATLQARASGPRATSALNQSEGGISMGRAPDHAGFTVALV